MCNAHTSLLVCTVHTIHIGVVTDIFTEAADFFFSLAFTDHV